MAAGAGGRTRRLTRPKCEVRVDQAGERGQASDVERLAAAVDPLAEPVPTLAIRSPSSEDSGASRRVGAGAVDDGSTA